MNTPTTPDLDALHKAVQEFQPAPSRIPFHALKPFHEFIVMLRAKRASYRSVAELLEKHGVHTSRARVAEYGRIILAGGKRRKRRKFARNMLADNAPTTPQSVPTEALKAAPKIIMAVANNVPPPPNGNFSYKSRGPRIAKIELRTDSALKPLASASDPQCGNQSAA